jgi:hypothetical protein
MARPRKWDTDAERRTAQDDRRKAERQRHDVHFIGIDGEGTGRWRDHKYVLLGVGNEQVAEPTGLGFTQIMSFLYSQYTENPTSAFVGFFLGYDFTQWFRSLPEQRARMLLTDQGKARRARKIAPQLGPFPVEYEGWEFDILGMKRFKLRETGKTGWMYINDAGPFFQASLMSVIDPKKWDEPIVTEDEYAILEEGKRRRDTANLDTGMRRYNALENTVLARLMGRLNLGLVEAGIRLRKNQWFGPGQAAQAWLGQIGAPTGEVVRAAFAADGTVRVLPGRRERLSLVSGGKPSSQAKNRTNDRTSGEDELLDAIRGSYYGGWFELFAHGLIPGITWEYDINSAYPHIISRLPCVLHGTWERRGPALHDSDLHGTGSGHTLDLFHARVRGTDRRIGTMLHRRPDHAILRPWQTAGWYWGTELAAAFRAGIIDDANIDQSWHYTGCDCRPPMRGIAGLYEQRRRAGKNTSAGKAYKLVYNSVYGKFAQSTGEPKFGNGLYASLITSGCRTMILDAIATHPKGTHGVVMVATDGVYFTSPHPHLEVGPELGSWEQATHSNLTLFKPGVYWDDATRERIAAGHDPAFKARGISARAFAASLSDIDSHFAGWPDRFPEERDPDGPRAGWYPKITFQSGFSMITCQQALQRGKWFLAGAVSDQKLTQDADPITKRHSGYYEDGIYWSRPYPDGGPEIESTPYDRRFGQPDPDEYGINDDGSVKDQWAKLILAK